MDLPDLLKDAFILAAPYLSKLTFIQGKLEMLSSFEDVKQLLLYIKQAEQEEEDIQNQTDWRIFRMKIEQTLVEKEK
ncbi:MAG: hypothetical protein ACFFC7_10465 [Candidatus Hermodarchaeota archaeon]